MVSTSIIIAERKNKMLQEFAIVAMVPVGIILGMVMHVINEKENKQ